MKLPPNIKPLPILLEKITKFTGLAFANNIYLRSSFYNDLLKDNPSAESVGILLHEEEHIKRRIKLGMSGFWWGLKFWLEKDFRYQEEMEANRVQFKPHQNPDIPIFIRLFIC